MLGGWGEQQDSRNGRIRDEVPRCLRCDTALEQVGEEWRCPACFERDMVSKSADELQKTPR